MTHTLHRVGDRKSLENDYVILAMAARGYNSEGAAPKFREILRIFNKYNPTNMGNMTAKRPLCMARGASAEEIIGEASDKSIIHAVYTDKEAVKAVLKELKKADLGISIVVSGLFDEIFYMCKEVSIEGPFTVNMSVGTIGQTERLPKGELLQILTMCGHGMVSKQLIAKQIEQVKKGRMTSGKAAEELARQCPCGIFNPRRAANLINKFISADK